MSPDDQTTLSQFLKKIEDDLRYMKMIIIKIKKGKKKGSNIKN